MEKSFKNLKDGYITFREKYVHSDSSIMRQLSKEGQKPETMVIACSDSRVDPALILNCEPGDLFVVRNVANIIPPYEKDNFHHGTSAALEFGICYLNIKHLIILGHSQCGGINAALQKGLTEQDDFISNWVSVVQDNNYKSLPADEYAKIALHKSHDNCLTFPWIESRVKENKLKIHRWFFDIKNAEILTYSKEEDNYSPL